jgi:copper homeostasis protein
MVLEICAESVESAIAAEVGGAQRIELCSDLLEGGITPSAGLIRSVRKQVALDLFVMIRPRGGDACYTAHEFEAMRCDVMQAREMGADGVVFGVLDPDGEVDVKRTRELVELARPLQATFHRAFDMTASLTDALSRVMDTGADRVLTSGGMQSAQQGSERIAELIERAENRIKVMVGGGIRQENIQTVALRTGAQEFHCSLRTRVEGPMRYRSRSVRLSAMHGDDYARFVVLEGNVRRLRRALDSIADGASKSVAR